MLICVAGWYLGQFDDFYAVMHRLHKKHPVFVVSNRENDYLSTLDLPYIVRENTGLEWGAYNWFLMHKWDGQSPVLFLHDDIIFNPYAVNGEIHPPEWLFDQIANLKVDQAYIFKNKTEDSVNYGRHGRMVFMGAELLGKAKAIGGFWYDKKNTGYTEGSRPELREKTGCYGYNAGILAFHEQARTIGGDVHRKVFVPSFGMCIRGNVEVKPETDSKFLSQAVKWSESAHNRLHLGCGANYWQHYTNVDLNAPKADVKADVRDLPFRDNVFDWAEAHHLIEHLNVVEAKNALAEWNRVLEPGGHLMISCPDLVWCANALRNSAGTPEVWDALLRAVYGVDEPGMLHRHGYCKNSLEQILRDAGFVDVEVKSVIGYRPTPNLLAIARKE